MPNAEKLMQLLRDYASLPAQGYPHHVRLQMPLVSHDTLVEAPYNEIPFKQRSGPYQRLKKCIRKGQSLETVFIDD